MCNAAFLFIVLKFIYYVTCCFKYQVTRPYSLASILTTDGNELFGYKWVHLHFLCKMFKSLMYIVPLSQIEVNNNGITCCLKDIKILQSFWTSCFWVKPFKVMQCIIFMKKNYIDKKRNTL